MDNNFVKQIDYIAIYPNKKYSNYNNAFIIFKDSNDHPFAIYVEEINSNVSISQVAEYINEMKWKLINTEKSVILEMKVCPDNKQTYFKIIDLDPPEPPKEMTKKEIEELLGYKIKIVERKE